MPATPGPRSASARRRVRAAATAGEGWAGATVPPAFVQARPPMGEPDNSARTWVYRHVSTAIVEGLLWPGLRLPSARALSRHWAVARGAVDEALMRLAREGLLERRVGRGSFIARRLPPGMVGEVSGRAALARQAGEALHGLAPLLRIVPVTVSEAVPAVGPNSGRDVGSDIGSGVGSGAGSSPASRADGSAIGGADRRLAHPRSGVQRPLLDPRVPDTEHFPLAAWRRCMAQAHAEADRASLCYGLPAGWPPLREATARHLALTRAIECTPEQVIVLNGPLQALDLIVRVLLEPGDSVVVERPGYMSIARNVGLPPLDFRAAPVDAEGLDVAAARRACPAPALIYVHPLNQYPTGVRLSAARRAALLAWARECRAWVIEGDHLGEIVHDGPVPQPLIRTEALALAAGGVGVASAASATRATRAAGVGAAAAPRDGAVAAEGRGGIAGSAGCAGSGGDGGQVLFLGTFNGVMFPSLRLSYLVVPRRLVPAFTAVRGLFGDHPPPAPQQALAAFMEGGHLSAHLRRMRALYRERRDAALAAARAFLPPEVRLGPLLGGTHGCLHLPAGIHDEPLAHRLAEDGLAIEMLSPYSWPQQGTGGIVFGYGADDVPRIEAGMQRLAGHVRQAIAEAAPARVPRAGDRSGRR